MQPKNFQITPNLVTLPLTQLTDDCELARALLFTDRRDVFALVMDCRILDDDRMLASGALELDVLVLLLNDLAVLVPFDLGVVGRHLDVQLNGVVLLDFDVLESFDEVDCFCICISKYFLFVLKNGPTPASFPFTFGLFKQTIQF